MDKEKELELEIKELEKQLRDKKTKRKRLKSMRGKERYFLDGDGTIYKVLPNAPLDFFETVTLQNNAFKTEEEATRERERRELMYDFNQFKDYCNDGWEVEWTREYKYFLFYSYYSKGFKVASSVNCTQFSPFGYFKNKEDAELAIKKFGDRIKRLYVD